MSIDNNDNRRIKKVLFNIAITGIMSALAAILMILEFGLPFLPSFLKFDFSELPALIASFSIGPIYGFAVCLVKNLIHIPLSMTGGIGELINFLIGIAFVVPSGIIYKLKKDRLGAFIGTMVGALFMTIIALPLNYYLTYPIYMKLFPIESILNMCYAIVPGDYGIFESILIFNLPLTFVKGIVDSAVTFLIYKKISFVIKYNKR